MNLEAINKSNYETAVRATIHDLILASIMRQMSESQQAMIMAEIEFIAGSMTSPNAKNVAENIKNTIQSSLGNKQDGK